MRRILIPCLLVLLTVSSFAQLKSPAQFLGYQPGERYTPHWKIVDYFRQVAANAGNVKLEEYGKTFEGRPLILAIISSPENMQSIDRIRLNNLRLANMANDKAAPTEAGSPAIVWLSYNVHGNEASSSEASMQTLFALADPANSKTASWLKNTVVIIDPCLNPDGRDRFVNWFNSVASKNADPKLISREHREPWPGGRTNHYYFDLNRDWAWQSQLESQQRIARYNQWMPQVHVDYHEQGVNDPYYFAPAAEPVHEVITQWQRDFQMSIGRNHAKYFDEKGWLYFTREIFDLFYPSYGDTWPMFNGSIGMTYEQGGGPAGGLAAQTDSGDTLTLADRVLHHFTTSLSTIEIASLNAGRLISSFRKYFNDAVNSGVGEYRTYVLRNKPADREKIRSLTELLTRNGIRYGYASGSAKGVSYASGREENFQMQNDLIVSSLQPKSALVKVLFEPDPRLPDSLTYDITAWSLPYAYGLTAWASREKIVGGTPEAASFIPNKAGSAYGYVIRWEGLRTAKTVAQLLKRGVRLRYSETPFDIDGRSFGRGSVIILNRGSDGAVMEKTLLEITNQNEVPVFPISTGMVDKGNDMGSDKVGLMKAPRVYMFTGEGVNSYSSGEVWHFFEQQLDYPLTLVNAGDANRIDWSAVDVLIMPPGLYNFLSDKTQAENFKQWIRRGGRVIALQQAIDALAKAEMGIKSKGGLEGSDKPKDDDSYDILKRYSDRERDFIPGSTSGSVFRVELDNTHPLAFGYPDHYYTLKLDDKIYEFMKDGWNVGVIKKEEPVAGFVGAQLKEKLKDGLLFGVQPMGGGSITYLVDDVLFRSFWENGKLMFANAVFLVR